MYRQPSTRDSITTGDVYDSEWIAVTAMLCCCFSVALAMEDLEAKAKHYFILYSRDHKRRQELVSEWIYMLKTTYTW